MKIIAGLDIGNGYIKGCAREAGQEDRINIDMPACAASIPNPTDVILFNTDNEIDDLYDRMNLTIDSPVVTGIMGSTRVYIGRRALESGQPVTSFDIESNVSKARQPLSAVLVLSVIAASGLLSYYKKEKALPDNVLEIDAVAAMALPISEYKRLRDEFSEKFTRHTHMVCFHNFEKPVRVSVKFSNVTVLAEGASAQVAIVNKGVAFMDALLQDVRAHGIALEGITSYDILAAEGTLGIDIGEGTVNFPVFTRNKFNTDFSANISRGYGTVLENALIPLAEANNIFHDRKSLGEFLNAEPSALKKRKYDAAKAIVNAESQTLVESIVREFTKILNRANGQIEVIYVFGGGATPIKDFLYPALIEASKSFSAGDEIPIMYLDSKYSRFLNREGLFQLAGNLAG